MWAPHFSLIGAALISFFLDILSKNVSDIILPLAQKKVNFSISFFYHLIRCIKKTKYTTRCSVKSSTIYQVKLILIVYVLLLLKTITISFAWEIVGLFHAASCSIFGFFYENILGDKKMK